MKYGIGWLVALTMFACCVGCAGVRAPVRPAAAFVYTHYKAPLMTDYRGDDFGSKKGASKSQYILVPWPILLDFAWGDAALHEAAKAGNITTLKAADYEYMSVLGIYQEVTVHAYGD